MTRVTRSQRAVSSNEAAVTEKMTKIRNTKNKVTKQDENSVPITKTSKVPVAKSKAGVLGSKLHSVNKDNSYVQKNTVLAMKSPVLRDRTNTSDDLIKKDLLPKKTNKSGNKNTKQVKKSVINKRTVKNSSKTTNECKISITRYLEKSKDNPKNADLKEVSKNNSKGRREIAELNREDDQEKEIVSEKIVEAAPLKKRSSRKMNISIEDVEKLLNEDDNDEDSENKENIDNIESNEKEVHCEVEKERNEEPKAKKFFKHKSVERETQPIITLKKTIRKPVIGRKRAARKVPRDSTFSPIVEAPRKSCIPEKKTLRTKTTKNYCEESKLYSTPEEKEKSEDNPTAEKDHKGVPIYKTIRLSEDHKENGEEVYAFPDDSQEMEPRGKKRKKTVKRTVTKRPKKAVIVAAKRPQKKPVKKNVPHTVQFMDQPKVTPSKNMNINNEKEVSSKGSISKSPVVIPEHLLDVGETTFEEASTIKILSDKKLDGSRKINLMATPNVPKTINSELKLFGTKNAVTSKPTTQYNNMVNHSLIRKSMSPITKIVDEFDAGSPWRPVDTFSRIQKIVQSTPQINRLPLNREKRLPVLKKKSISSEDTIHNSALAKENASNAISPRKFGTVISNVSSNSNDSQKSPIQAVSVHSPVSVNNKNSPVQATSPGSSLPNIPMNDTPTILVAESKNLESPNKSLKKKVNTPSPFRFEKVRSSKRTALAASPSKSASQNIVEDFEPEPGPSWIDKPRPVLVQTNLDSFLNKDEMPKPACIKTRHGIFDDIHSTPITDLKPRKPIEEANIENAFGFDDFDISDVSPVIEATSTPRIATKIDVKNSKKGKVFPKARVKSAVPSRISENTVKKTLLRNVLKKDQDNRVVPKIFHEEDDDNHVNKENDNSNADPADTGNFDPKKDVLDAVSFSDTFDVLSENGENLQSEVPESIPLFVDLEPVHFSQPPRRSYNKRKRAVQFDTSMDDFWEDEILEKQKPKKKKENKLSKEDKKRMQQWVKEINSTFDEIEHYDLVVE